MSSSGRACAGILVLMMAQLFAATPAIGARLVLVGGGDAATHHTYWENWLPNYCCGDPIELIYSNCQQLNVPSSLCCGDLMSSGGQLPGTGCGQVASTAAGMSHTAGVGALHYSIYADAAVADCDIGHGSATSTLDASTPLVFVVLPSGDDPAEGRVDLVVTCELANRDYLVPLVSGGSAFGVVDASVDVGVGGQRVTAALNTSFQGVNGSVTYPSISFPQGTLTRAIPGVRFGDSITVAAHITASAVVGTHSRISLPIQLDVDVSMQTVTAVPHSEPRILALSSAQPSPFSRTTSLVLSLDRQERVEASVLDLSGRRHASLLDGSVGPGQHVLTWDGRRTDGSLSPSGVYFVRVRVGSERLVQRAVLLGGR